MTTRVDMGDEHRRRQAKRQAEAVAAASQPATRGEVAAAVRSAPTGAVPPGGLPALGSRRNPKLPPSQLAHQHHADLGDRIAVVEKARSAALEAANEWLETLPGGSGFREAVESERRLVHHQLDKREPVPAGGPIHDLLVDGQLEALAEAHRSQLVADYREAKVREFAPEAKDTLGDLADAIEGDIRDLFERAAAEKKLRLYEDARALCRAWLEVSSLHEWCLAPSQPFRRRQPDAIPRSLALEEQAAVEALGLERYVVDAVDVVLPPGQPAPDSQPRQGFIRRFLGS